ncbi:MAG: T9SS type A sorting domain-containing protein [Bacteroidota bacterium]
MRNDYRVFLLLLLIILINKDISAQIFQWTKRAGWYAFDLGYGIGTDNDGNVYVAGKYEMNANFDGTYVSCEGNHDIFVAKYGPAGDFKWVRTAGGILGDYAHALACDGDGNVYITGEIEETVHFGSTTLTSNGNNDVFIAKYNTDGDLQWAKSLGGGVGIDRGLGISLSNENIYITGHFEATAYFTEENTFTSSGEFDLFVAKYTSEGIFKWIRTAGGPGHDGGYAISNDKNGNVYVTGVFSDTANFSGTTLSSGGGEDIFIAKYNPVGDLLWLKRAGGKGRDFGMGIKVDDSDKVFFTGGFERISDYDSISLSAIGDRSDIFVARYTSSGDAVWVRSAGGRIDDFGIAIALDARSNCYITGNYGLSSTFGKTTIAGSDPAEIYFASYDVDGNYKWVMKAEGVADDSDFSPHGVFSLETGLCICTDPSGNVFASGSYRSNSTFGSTTLGNWGNHTEIFITKIGLSFDLSNAHIIPSRTATFCRDNDVILKTHNDSTYKYRWKKNGVTIEGATGYIYRASSPGSYAVMIISENDSVLTEATIVTESKNIAVSIAPSDPIFCQDSSTVLITNTQDEYEYEWKRNGEIIPEANQKSYKTDKSGDYQVKIIEGACFNWSGITNISLQNCLNPNDTPNKNTVLNNSNTSHLQAKDDSLLIKIFPNPNSGLFSLEINMIHTSELIGQATVEMLNSIGQSVYHKLISFNNGYINEHIELSNSVSPGIYFLQVTIGDMVEKKQMMLSK